VNPATARSSAGRGKNKENCSSPELFIPDAGGANAVGICSFLLALLAAILVYVWPVLSRRTERIEEDGM
jgi:hypothetical protein